MSRLGPKRVKILHRTISEVHHFHFDQRNVQRIYFKSTSIFGRTTQIVTPAQGRSQSRTPFDPDKEKDLHGHGHGHQHDTNGQTQMISTPHIGN